MTEQARLDAIADAETLRGLGEARVLFAQVSLPGERWPLTHAAEILPYLGAADIGPEYYAYVARQDARSAFAAVPALRGESQSAPRRCLALGFVMTPALRGESR